MKSAVALQYFVFLNPKSNPFHGMPKILFVAEVDLLLGLPKFLKI